MSKKITYKHSGDMGDIIFSLPVIKHFGTGILYLDPNGGEGCLTGAAPSRGKTKLNSKTIELLKPLLESQYYIHEVREWKGEEVTYNLDKFREHIKFNNLTHSHLEAFGLPLEMANFKWLEAPEKIQLPEGKKTVISRSVRYQGNHFYWETLAEHLSDHSVFVGLPFDHKVWEYTFENEVEYMETPTLVELANVIGAADLFIGNQGLPHAIAEGMKKNLVNEVDKTHPAAVFKRDDASYV
tara:strand:+ start:1011 stop:1730 length:720 start_codon:yes stop_codon:yes gene_type:complete